MRRSCFRKPPRLADWLLARSLPAGGKGESIRGDLIEEYQDRLVFPRLWFWAVALQLSGGYFFLRVRKLMRKFPLSGFLALLEGSLPGANDLRQTLRSLAGTPGFLVVSVLTLGLGIGANATIFSVVHGVLLEPLPYPHPQRLVVLWPERTLSHQVLEIVRDRSSSFQAVAGIANSTSSLIPSQGDPVELSGGGVTEGYFSLLGQHPFLGRDFLPRDHLPGAEPVVILDYFTWRDYFDENASIIGHRIRLGAGTRIVVGVLPAGYHPLSRDTSYWVPLLADPNSPVFTGRTWLRTLARLAPDATFVQAQAELTHLARLVARQYPSIYGEAWIRAARVASLHQTAVAGLSTRLWVLQGAVLFIFLIACSNMANLLLARGVARRPETAIRQAFGASRWRIVQQLMIESLILGLLGGLAGLLLASWLSGFLSNLSRIGVPFAERIGVNWMVAAFTLIFSLIAGILFGLAPAWMNSRADIRSCLGHSRQPVGSSGHRNWRSMLVAAEVALAVVLVCGAGLLLTSLHRLSRIDPGFQPDQVITARLSPSRSRYPDGKALVQFFDIVLRRVRGLPWVREAGGIHMLPLASRGFSFSYVTPEHPVPPDQPRPTASVRLVMPGYFKAMGIPLLRGRSFESEDQAESPAVGLVNAALAHQLWPSQDPVGKKIHFFSLEEPPFEVVGVVGDVHQNQLDAPPLPEIYRPLAQYPWGSLSLTIRVSGNVQNRLEEIRSLIRSVDKETTISEIETLCGVIYDSISDSRFYTLLISLFGFLALSLGLIGVYGVMAYSVRQRRHEIGVRMALGARRASVTRTLLSWGLRRVLLGMALGLPLAAVTNHLLRGVLYGVEPLDPAIMAGVVLFVGATATLAILLPTRRAVRIDPVRVLGGS